MIVMLGELGGDNEYGIVRALKEKKVVNLQSVPVSLPPLLLITLLRSLSPC